MRAAEYEKNEEQMDLAPAPEGAGVGSVFFAGVGAETDRRRLVLVGAEEGKGGKRQDFFLRAAASLGHSVKVLDYEGYLQESREGDLVKLDPPPFAESCLDQLRPFVRRYQGALDQMSALKGVVFWNEPEAIKTVLDKVRTAEILAEHGVRVPEEVPGPIDDWDTLAAVMEERRIGRVFVKPRWGSGASGVIAYARRRKDGKEVLYTSLQQRDGAFFNTKQMIRSEDPERNRQLLNRVLREDHRVERWLPKASKSGIAWDLRVVWQLGQVVYIVPRGSRGPITNLHLNDMALDLSDLEMSEPLRNRIAEVCGKAMACFPGLRGGGLDVLIPPPDENGQQEPVVIEINGQGDLIYRDIFAKNEIYRQQAGYLLGMERSFGDGKK